MPWTTPPKNDHWKTILWKVYEWCRVEEGDTTVYDMLRFLALNVHNHDLARWQHDWGLELLRPNEEVPLNIKKKKNAIYANSKLEVIAAWQAILTTTTDWKLVIQTNGMLGYMIALMHVWRDSVGSR